MNTTLWTKPYENRRTFLGGSDARIIMGSDEAALVRLWREKRGEAEPEDLSGNLIVQLGAATEPLNRSWYERNTGRRVRDVQRRVRHSAIAWMVATLDGIVEGTEAVFESKFMLPWSFSEEAAAEKYMPQLQHNMWVTHLRTSVLSIITGGGKWVEIAIPMDPLYLSVLVSAEKKFWRCVQSGEVPHLLAPIAERQRRPEHALWREFELARPYILGALLDAVAHGLHMLPQVRLQRLPRMADFALWATACESAFCPAGTFEAAYSNNRRDAIENIIEADPVAAHLRELMAERAQWMGRASDLLQAGANRSGWPKSPRALAGRLRRAQTFLRTVGIEIAFGREGRFGTRIIRITAIGENQLHDTVSTVSRVSDKGDGAGLNHSSSGLEQVL